MRIGHGFDAHRFILGRPLVLGGVPIPFEKGLEAHSDGDVVIHALCDALLGAIGKGDIGRHFPDTDIQFSGIDSRILLRRVIAMVHEQKFQIGNIDMTILAQAPRLAKHMDAMRVLLAEDLSSETNQINIKATTTEGMGYIGRGEGIGVHAVVLLVSGAE
ncbi:2-C-methyl-D-erythritol 2,4-cyclodiphosphate synthase [Gammaproteobacteria bacterium]